MNTLCPLYYTEQDLNKMSQIPGTFMWIKQNLKKEKIKKQLLSKVASDINKLEKIKQKIKQAGLKQQLIEIEYVDKKGQKTRRIVEPYKLTKEDLFAFCRTRNDIRRFKLQQIIKIKNKRQKFNAKWPFEYKYE